MRRWVGACDGKRNSWPTPPMDCCRGRVVGEHRSHYQVATDATELTAGTTGHLRNTALLRSDLPGVGDFVALRLAQGDGPATIEAVLARTGALIREAPGERRPQLLAANIDVVFIMTALDGDFNLLRIERYLQLVWESGATPVIVVNKADVKNDVIEPNGQIEGSTAAPSAVGTGPSRSPSRRRSTSSG